jgi:hypothetical protein
MVVMVNPDRLAQAAAEGPAKDAIIERHLAAAIEELKTAGFKVDGGLVFVIFRDASYRMPIYVDETLGDNHQLADQVVRYAIGELRDQRETIATMPFAPLPTPTIEKR